MTKGELVIAIVTGLAVIVALLIGLISLHIQNKARRDRIEQEEHKANKLRFQISEELNNLLKIYGRLQKRVGTEKLANEFEEALRKLEHLYRQPILLKTREVFTLELIISTTRVLVKGSLISGKSIEETLNHIANLKSEIWKIKKAALQPKRRNERKQ